MVRMVRGVIPLACIGARYKKAKAKAEAKAKAKAQDFSYASSATSATSAFTAFLLLPYSVTSLFRYSVTPLLFTLLIMLLYIAICCI